MKERMITKICFLVFIIHEEGRKPVGEKTFINRFLNFLARNSQVLLEIINKNIRFFIIFIAKRTIYFYNRKGRIYYTEKINRNNVKILVCLC